jgi:hypothetical protein
MPYNYPKLFNEIVRQVSASGPITSRMLAVIDECERQRPADGWKHLRELDYEQDGYRLSSWLTSALAEGPASASFKGLWFGLFNPVVDGDSSADIYVAGSAEFEPTGIDWACNSTFYPEGRYLESAVLGGIYRIAYRSDDGLGNDAEHPLVIACGAMLAKAALESITLRGPFRPVEGAAVGFDSGDFFFLGSFVGGKLKPKVTIG